MKKIMFIFVATVAMSFVSCGNKANGTDTANDSLVNDTVVVDSVDTCVVDTTVCPE